MAYEGVPSCGFETHYGSMILLVLFLVGVLGNISVCTSLRTHWSCMGNSKILIITCVFSNTLTLLSHTYEPLNSILQGCSLEHCPHESDRWALGASMCSVLPTVAKFSLSAFLVSLGALALCCYHKTVHNYRMTNSEAETIAFVVWAIAATLTAPLFFAQDIVYDPEHRAELCVTIWNSNRQADLNDAWLIVLQYAIPFTTIMSCLAKTILYPTGHNQVPCWYPFVSTIIDLLSIAAVFSVVYLIPLAPDSFHGLWPNTDVMDVHQTLHLLETLTLSVCFLVPLVFQMMINREAKKTSESLLLLFEGRNDKRKLNKESIV